MRRFSAPHDNRVGISVECDIACGIGNTPFRLFRIGHIVKHMHITGRQLLAKLSRIACSAILTAESCDMAFFTGQAVDVSGPLPNAATLLMAIWMLRFIFLYKRNPHFGKSCLFLQESIIIVVPVCVAEPFGHSKLSTAFTPQISKGYIGAKHLIEHLSRRLCVHIASVISLKNVPQHLSFLTP